MKEFVEAAKRLFEFFRELDSDEEVLDNAADANDNLKLSIAKNKVKHKEKEIRWCEHRIEDYEEQNRDTTKEKRELAVLRDELEDLKQSLIEVEKAVNKRKRQREARERKRKREKLQKREKLESLREENPDEYIRIISEDPVLYKQEQERLKREGVILGRFLENAEAMQELEDLKDRYPSNLVEKYAREREKIQVKLADDPALAKNLIGLLKSQIFEGEE